MTTRMRAQGGAGGSFQHSHISRTYGAGGQQTQAFVYKSMKQMDHERREGRRKEGPSPIAIRPISIDDASYVIDSWARSYRRSQTTGAIDDDVFKVEQRARIDRLICRSKTFIACEPNEPRQIRGWICFEPGRVERPIPIVHYVCVQPSHQLSGIGTALIDIPRQTAADKEAFMWSTHETQPMRHVRSKWNLLYNPYLLEVKA